MAKDIVIDIDGEEFTGVTMSAANQFEVLHIVMQRGATISAIKEGTADASSVIAMGAIPFEDLKRVEKLALSDIVRAHDGVPVDRNLFRDRIELYYLLLARVLSENLKGFWMLHRRAGNGEPNAVEQPESSGEPGSK